MIDKVLVSIIVPTYNRGKILLNVINSVLDQNFKSFELIIVDQTVKRDESFLRSLEKIKDDRLNYYLVTPPSLPSARNFGLKKARGEVIIYIDDDVILEKDFIKNHFESFQNNPKIGAVVGRIKEKEREESLELMHFDKANFIVGGFDYPNESLAEFVRGCNMSFRNKVLEKLGGFDSNFIGNSLREDSDVSFRLKKLGYKILYNPKASLIHLFVPYGGCREEDPIYENYIFYRNDLLFYLKNRAKLDLPIFLYKVFKTYVFNKELIKRKVTIKRLKVFLIGVVDGFFTYLLPAKQIISKEISNQ